MGNMTIKNLDKIIKASSDVNRMRILKMLRSRKLCVCEIAFVLEITQPSVSRHLKKLKATGFIESENEGLWTNYYLQPKNAYAKNFISGLDKWIDSDKTIIQDAEKIRSVNREKLCCL
ncbi:MAG: metalloregulator ArsR/SmtB family transcription factor [Candidatus Omnitrophota bacterium]